MHQPFRSCQALSKARFRRLLHRLQAGENPQELKSHLQDTLRRTSAEELIQIQGELFRERFPRRVWLMLNQLHLDLLHEGFPTSRWDAA